MARAVADISSWVDEFQKLIHHLLVAFLAILIVFALDWLCANWTDSAVIGLVSRVAGFIKHNSWLADGFATVAVFFFIQVNHRVIRHYRRGTAADAAGMFYCSPNCGQPQSRKSEKYLKKMSRSSKTIRLSGATGLNTFVSHKSPLREAMLLCPDIKVVLFDPTSPELIRRARDLGIDPGVYRDEIYCSIHFLEHLKITCPTKIIDLKFYSNYPFWKYVFLDDCAWIWQYPSNCHVRSSPCYAFARQKTNRLGMYEHMEQQFIRRWNRNSFYHYDFLAHTLKRFNESGELEEKDYRVRPPEQLQLPQA